MVILSVVSGCTQVELLKVIISQDHSLIDRANKVQYYMHAVYTVGSFFGAYL